MYNKYDEVKEKLYSPGILDILDSMGYRNQGMDYQIRPLVVDGTKVMGPAFTILAAEVYEIPKEPFKGELAAIDKMEDGNVIVGTTQGSMGSAFFGELIATRCRFRGVRGAIIDGCTRDTAQIEKMKFPLFVRGISPLDSMGRMDVIADSVPVVCGGVLVHPGDVVFADRDGIAVIPKDIVEEVIEKTLEKMRMEDIVREELANGISATEVYDKYHVL